MGVDGKTYNFLTTLRLSLHYYINTSNWHRMLQENVTKGIISGLAFMIKKKHIGYLKPSINMGFYQMMEYGRILTVKGIKSLKELQMSGYITCL